MDAIKSLGLALAASIVLFCGAWFLPAKAGADDLAGAGNVEEGRFSLNLDVAQGFAGKTQFITPYRSWLKLTPEFKLGSNWRWGPFAGFRYDNPDWDFGLGLRADYLFWKFATDTGFRLAADAAYWDHFKNAFNNPIQACNTTAEGGLVFDLSGLGRLGLWCGYDFDLRASTVMISSGVDLASITKIFAPNPQQPDFRVQAPPPKDGKEGKENEPGKKEALSKHKKIALVISGGGATGAWAVGAVEYLEKYLKEKDKSFTGFDIVCGTSTGSLMAPLVVTGEYKELQKIYSSIGQNDIFLMRSPADMISNASLVTSQPLQGIINNMVTPKRWDAIQASPMRMILSTSCLQTSRVTYFYTGPGEIQTGVPGILPNDKHMETSRIGDPDTLMRAMLASSSDPVLCPATHIPKNGYHQYVDGGVESFTALKIALMNGADEVYAVILAPKTPPPVADQFNDLEGILSKTLDMLANRVAFADEEEAELTRRVFKDHHQDKVIKIIRPCCVITSTPHVFNEKLMTEWITEGYNRAEEVLTNQDSCPE